jgi:DNA-binding transcriptional LysR family regulator
MFAKLFMDAGLSLDRLRALVEVGAAGSIAKATDGDPIRQSQYSRQIKELEDFFHAKMIERHGKGIRLTPAGKELARISRFFLLGLSNFRRGCLADEQAFRIGASATFVEHFLMPALAKSAGNLKGPRYVAEIAGDNEIERRLHDLTLDFGVVTTVAVSRPLQLKALGDWRLCLWVAKTLCRDEAEALRLLAGRRLPMVLPVCELSPSVLAVFKGCEPRLSAVSFVQAKASLEQQGLAALLPDFLVPERKAGAFVRVRVPALESLVHSYQLTWNPRMLRLNPHAIRQRDALWETLSKRMPRLDGVPAFAATTPSRPQ